MDLNRFKKYLFRKSLFAEGRFVFDDPEAVTAGAGGATPEAVKTSVEEAEKVGIEAKAALIISKAKIQTSVVGGNIEADIKKDAEEAFDFLSPENINVEEKQLDKWRLSVNREYKTINADNWKPYTKDGIVIVKKDWAELGLSVSGGTPFYDKIFEQLGKSTNVEFLDSIRDPKVERWYRNPEANLGELAVEDPEFYRAYSFFISVQDTITLQNLHQEIAGQNVEDLDTDKYLAKAEDALKRNWNKFSGSVKNRDYATAGMYVLGAWAVYRSVKELSKGKEGQVAKWTAYGAAAYFGLKFAKTAGYDPLKALGLKDEFAEVAGTSLGRIAYLGIPEVEDVDGAVYARAEKLNLRDLNRLYVEETNSTGSGDRRIDPGKFAYMPEFAEFAKPKAELGKDEYRDHVGRQLYLIAHVMAKGYEKTLALEEDGNYKGKSFTEALGEDILRQSNVRQFTDSLADYAPTDLETGILEEGAVKKMRDRLISVFPADKGLAPDFEMAAYREGKQALAGSVMDFPVIVVPNADTKKYLVYTRKEYIDTDGIPSHPLAEIPFEGDAITAVDDLEAAITEKMEKVIEPIKSKGGTLSKIQYQDGHWTADVEIPAAAEHGIDATTGLAKVTMRDDGSVDIDIEKIGLHANLDYFMDQEELHAGTLLTMLVNHKDMAVLVPFYDAKTISFEESLNGVNGKPRFSIRVAGEVVKVTHDVDAESFSISDTDQKKLLNNPKFRREYVNNYVEHSKEFNEVFGELEELIELAPEEFHMYFFEGMGSWFTDASLAEPLKGLNLDFMSGSVNDYYALSVVESKKQMMVYAMMGKMRGMDKFSEIGDAKAEIWTFSLSRLRSVIGDLRSKPDAWDRDMFMGLVADPIKRVGMSTSYFTTYNDLEAKAYTLFGKGSDVFKDSHENINHLKNVFAFHTAYLDGDDLNSLPYPAPPSHTSNPKKDADLDPYFKLQYFEYVKREVLAKAERFGRAKKTPENWGIRAYDEWKESMGTHAPVEKLNSKPKLEHKLHREGNTSVTELDKEIAEALRAEVDYLKATYPGSFKHALAKQYLDRKPGPNVPSLEVGILRTQLVDGKVKCQLWDDSDTIYDEATNRYEQERMIQDLRNGLVSHFFTKTHPNSKDSYYFSRPISLKTGILQKYPSMVTWPIIGSILL